MGAIDDLAAALDGHQVTDEEGQAVETDTTKEISTPEEQTTEEKTATAEKPAESSKPAPAEEEETESELAVDDSGKRYIPKSRFDKVYGEKKAAERKNEALEKQVQGLMSTGLSRTEAQAQVETKPDKTEALEIEVLKGKFPQFDPESDKYSEDLDKLGFDIYKANPGITRTEAARRSMNIAKKLTQDVAEAQAEARLVKSIQSDQGITGRTPSRGETQIDPSAMSLEEMETFLRKSGQW